MKAFVYILTNKRNKVLYIGVTSNIWLRILMHKRGKGSFFTRRYNLKKLVYFEVINGIMNAIKREKALKRWHKEWKWNLIKNMNPDLMDLSQSWYGKDEII